MATTHPATGRRLRQGTWARRAAALAAATLLALPVGLGEAWAETPAPQAPVTATPAEDTSTEGATRTPVPAEDPQPLQATPEAESPETVAPEALSAGESAIATKYAGSASVLGSPTADVVCGLADDGCFQSFQNGAVYWSPATGARWTRGEIRKKWGATGYEDGVLGYPITDEICGLTGNGCVQIFQKGSIHWSPASGAHWSRGEIRNKWAATGAENGVLGYPITDEICGLTGNGCVQIFQNGSIHWSPASGAHWSRGAIRDKWALIGAENGNIGYPVTDEICGLAKGGCVQVFQRGSIHWSPTTGAHWSDGQVQALWGQRGYENGSYGYPTGDPYIISGKTSQRFEGGYLTSGVDTRCLTGRTMCASKNDRKLRWMIDGQVIKTLDARFGCTASPSDNGSFKVYWKSYNHTSTLYNTWMPRAMFYNGGEAVHYSGDFAARGYAGCSHGCVNIRDWDGINWLYGQVREGDKVVVYN